MQKKDTIRVSLAALDDPVVAAGNIKDVNVGQTPTNPTIDLKSGNSYANLFTGVSSRKSVNFRTLFTHRGGNKKKDTEPTIKVSNSNPFDVLNLVENDVDLGTNGGTSNLASKKANSSGSLFWNVDSSDEGKPLTKVDSLDDHDSEDEVASESYGNGDCDYDPYDDDMYEAPDIHDKIQDICDNLDIKVHGHKKK
uniref:Uncharacterized protein n=1 Tax=Tanacetum cinerariifolium TaxID=118510 RepID=A0A6L2JNG1_TANCI|nr:hypothetical protein [Tanacetum cinerariifolium]GEU60043.1 hypothetical protein [Tanacetum cinerariifolium]